LVDSNIPIDKEQVDTTVKSLVEQIDTLAKIASEFSNFAKMPQSNFLPVDLVEIIKNVKEVFQATIDNEIEFFHAKRECMTLGDKDLLLRVFNNLIKNALQAIPESRDPKIGIFIHKLQNHWVIEIKDNGSGIPEENKLRIFTPNFTTKTSGSGLGLAMVKQIIDMHQGEISLESSPRGTTFTIKLKVLEQV